MSIGHKNTERFSANLHVIARLRIESMNVNIRNLKKFPIPFSPGILKHFFMNPIFSDAHTYLASYIHIRIAYIHTYMYIAHI